MANTTNFNWETPDDTDLVKDGAAAIRTLGSAIDTSLVDLKGGTTGQILSKATNTDMDFTWITNDVGDITAVNVSSPITGGGSSGAVTISIQDGTTAQKGAVQLENSTSSTSTTTAAVPASVKSAYDLADGAIAKSIVDAKGDLIVGSAADAVARLAVGSNDQVLTADSSATYGVKWAAAATGGGMTSLASGSLSGGSLSLTSISGSYNNLQLILKDYVLTSGSGGTSFTVTVNSVTDYNNLRIASQNNAAALGSEYNDASANIAPFFNGFADGSADNSAVITFFDYANTTAHKLIQSIVGFERTGSLGAINITTSTAETTAAITSITCTPNAGNFIAGTYELFGVK